MSKVLRVTIEIPSIALGNDRNHFIESNDPTVVAVNRKTITPYGPVHPGDRRRPGPTFCFCFDRVYLQFLIIRTDLFLIVCGERLGFDRTNECIIQRSRRSFRDARRRKR